MGEALGIPVLRHVDKKPGGSREAPELSAFFGCAQARVCMLSTRCVLCTLRVEGAQPELYARSGACCVR